MNNEDMTTFLLARITEDETRAREVMQESDETAGFTLSAHLVARLPEPALSHVLRWGPKGVLVECEAKRRVVEMYLDAERSIWIDRFALADATRILAAVYAEHPDYREEWRP